MTNFEETMHRLQLQHEQLLTRKNMPTDAYNGIFTRYRHPILTAAHTRRFSGATTSTLRPIPTAWNG